MQPRLGHHYASVPLMQGESVIVVAADVPRLRTHVLSSGNSLDSDGETEPVRSIKAHRPRKVDLIV